MGSCGDAQLQEAEFQITMKWHKITILLTLALPGYSQDCTCRPKSVCGWVFLTRSTAECQLPGGRGGVCCPLVLPRRSTRQGLLSDRTPSTSEGSVKTAIVESTVTTFSLGSRESETAASVETSNDDTTTEAPDLTVNVGDIAPKEETSGYRLFKKAKKEFDDLNIYARKLLQGS